MGPANMIEEEASILGKSNALLRAARHQFHCDSARQTSRPSALARPVAEAGLAGLQQEAGNRVLYVQLVLARRSVRQSRQISLPPPHPPTQLAPAPLSTLLTAWFLCEFNCANCELLLAGSPARDGRAGLSLPITAHARRQRSHTHALLNRLSRFQVCYHWSSSVPLPLSCAHPDTVVFGAQGGRRRSPPHAHSHSWLASTRRADSSAGGMPCTTCARCV